MMAVILAPRYVALGLRAGAIIDLFGGLCAERKAIVPKVTTPRELPSPGRARPRQLPDRHVPLGDQHFAERLEWIKGDPMTVEEYLARPDAGDTFEPRVPLDRDRLARMP
jgi:hypothetical protein